VDPEWFSSDPDPGPDPAFHFIPDPDPAPEPILKQGQVGSWKIAGAQSNLWLQCTLFIMVLLLQLDSVNMYIIKDDKTTLKYVFAKLRQLCNNKTITKTVLKEVLSFNSSCLFFISILSDEKEFQSSTYSYLFLCLCFFFPLSLLQIISFSSRWFNSLSLTCFLYFRLCFHLNLLSSFYRIIE
jgi:hypothetical protein